MQQVLSILVAAFALLLAAPVSDAPAAEPPLPGTLTVVVNGVEASRGGWLHVAIFNDASNFPNGRWSGFTIFDAASLKDGRAEMPFPVLEPGFYAVATFHDENKNKMMDFNLAGLPKEGYGFSRAKGAGIPDFDEAKVEVLTRQTIKTSIVLRY